MSKKQYVLLLAVALVAGLAGSAVSSYFVLSRGLIAQNLPSAPEPPKTTGEDLLAKYGVPPAAPTRAFVVWENNGRGFCNPIRTYGTLEDCQRGEELYTAPLAEHPNDVALPASSGLAAVKNREIRYICLPDSVNPNLGRK